MITKQSLILTFNFNYDRKRRSPWMNQEEVMQLNNIKLRKIKDSTLGQFHVKLRCTKLGMQVFIPRQQLLSKLKIKLLSIFSNDNLIKIR